jgi:tetratricopeptide (TPR) repeat protein
MFSANSAFSWDNNSIDQHWHTQDIAELTRASEGGDFQHLYAHYRLAMIAIYQDDKKTAKKSLDTIRKALKGKYKTADEAALYSASLGQSITLKPWQAAFIAGGAEEALEYSFELTDTHAPTLMVQGIAKYNTPSMLGGDREVALELFEKAIELYKETEAWGYEDAWLWKTKALYALDRSQEAIDSLNQLRATYPDYYEAAALTFE